MYYRKGPLMSGEHWFTYHGDTLEPFYHMYNLTHLNERMVELAVARHWGYPWKSARGLEVGNVLGHYWSMQHQVIDLYEKPAWYQTLNRQPITSVDLLSLSGVKQRQFPWVVSISTIEHTEDPILAIEVLMGLTKPGGALLITFPTGVRAALDELVLSGLSGARMTTIGREDNDCGGWVEFTDPELREYGPWANSVAIIEWNRPS